MFLIFQAVIDEQQGEDSDAAVQGKQSVRRDMSHKEQDQRIMNLFCLLQRSQILKITSST